MKKAIRRTISKRSLLRNVKFAGPLKELIRILLFIVGQFAMNKRFYFTRYILSLLFTLHFSVGAGAVSIVVTTIAGALSPPLMLAIAKHRKYTSNQWWTYTRKQRYLAIGWGVVVGTVMLPLLAPWGIYKLFKVLGTKLLHNTIYWMRLLDSRGRGFEEEETDENSREWHVEIEGGGTHRAKALFVLAKEETKIDQHQSIADPDQPQAEPSQPIQPEAVGYNDGLQDEVSCCVDENFADVKPVGAILGSIKEEDDELEDLGDSCHKCTGTVWKPGNGRDALSDEENDDGRRDTQRLWARKAVSDTFFDVKIPDEDFKEREHARGLGERLCVAHQKREETKRTFNGEEYPMLQVLAEWRQWRMAKESRDEEEAANNVLAKWLQDTDQGEEISSTPQCQEIKDLPEKGPKKTKKRRKRRTAKQLVMENLDSSSASEANESLRKEEMDQETSKSQLLKINNFAEAEKEETELQAEKTAARKSRKARQPAQEMTGEKQNQIVKKRTKTKKAKHPAEKMPRTPGKSKEEEQQTHGARRQIACRFATSSPKKNLPETKDCPKQKLHETLSKNPFTVSSKGVEVDAETKRRGRLERMNAFRIKIDDFKKLKPGATVVSSTSSEHDIVALYDEID